MAPLLRLDRGTLVMWEVPKVVSAYFMWDARSQFHRAHGQACFIMPHRVPDAIHRKVSGAEILIHKFVNVRLFST